MEHNFIWTPESSRRNKLTCQYEPVQPHFFLELLKTRECTHVFDIGANIGYYSLISVCAPSVETIHAFEATPLTFDHLERNCKLNRLDSKITCFNKAVSNEEGVVEFYLQGEELSGINSIGTTTIHDKRHFQTSTSVQAVVIDEEYSAVNENVGLKIDVEGHELEVLAGCKRTLMNNNCVVQIEAYRENQEKVKSFFENLGYRSILDIGSDHYFVRDAFDSLEVYERFVSRAMSGVIAASRKTHLTTSVFSKIEVTAQVEGDSVVAQCSVDQEFFGNDAEYAFYFHVAGERREVSWYGEQARAVFPIPADAAGAALKITGFARQKNFPDRKLLKSVTL
jgi:FkbM family methyltransferase